MKLVARDALYLSKNGPAILRAAPVAYTHFLLPFCELNAMRESVPLVWEVKVYGAVLIKNDSDLPNCRTTRKS